MNFKSQYLALIIGLICFTSSCFNKTQNQNIRAIGTNSNLFGFSNSLYKIGDEFNFNNVDTTGLFIKVDEDKLISVTMKSSLKYELSNGIRIGNSKEEIISKMGKPLRDKIPLSKGAIEIGGINALVYKNVLIMLDKQNNAKQISLAKTSLGTPKE